MIGCDRRNLDTSIFFPRACRKTEQEEENLPVKNLDHFILKVMFYLFDLLSAIMSSAHWSSA